MSFRPDSIYFVYGPINSGKTELFQHLIELLPDDFVTFYVNLRERMIRDYNDFVEAIFEISESKRVVLKELVAEVTKFAGIPISKSLLDVIFKEDRPKNAFRYIVKVTEEIRERGKKPILIIDELQKIGDVKVNDYLIYELFNLFVRLTKELHCCYVFTITSDSLFIERVFNEAMLQGRCDYMFVDDFDYSTTVGFLKRYGFDDEEIEITWNYFGGKPIYLVKAIKNRHRLKEFCEESLEDRTSFILYRLRGLEEEDGELFQRVLSLFEIFLESETTKCDKISKEVVWSVKSNILFLDPRKRLLRPQSKLDLLAVRNVLEILSKKILNFKSAKSHKATRLEL